MKNSTFKVGTASAVKKPSTVMGVVMMIFGAVAFVFGVVWMLPQTVASPIQFPKETGFRFFNGALIVFAIVTLAMLIMGILILKERKKAYKSSYLEILQLIASLGFIILVAFMVGAPFIYNLFLLAAVIPVGVVLLIYMGRYGLPKVRKGVTWGAVILGVLVVLVPACLFTGYTMYSYLSYSIQNDKYAVATDFKKFEAECLDGTKIDQNYFKEHKLTMVNCWETICGPCIAEMPDLEKIYEAQDSPDFTIIGICCDCISGGKVKESTVSDAKQIVDEGITYPIVIPTPELEKGIISDIGAFPTTFFVDSDGNVIKTVLGSKEKKEWEEIIGECLKDVEAGE